MNRVYLRKISACAFAAMCVGLLFLGAASAGKQAAPTGVNLYQDVMSRAAAIKWAPAPADYYPDDACRYLDACPAGGSVPQHFALPVATIDGRKVARAVYLVKIKDPKNPQAIVFEHQSASQVYFFRLAPDGSILKSAYLETGGSWLLIANQLGQPIFNKDAADWHAALAKAAAPAPKSAQ